MPDNVSDLGEHIDRVIDGGVVDIAEVALKVRATTPAEVIEAHLLAFLRAAVRDRLAKRRAVNPIIRGAAALRFTGRPVAVSSKRARQRDRFAEDRARWLADTVWTGTRRVTLGEATAEDLMGAASSMREQAARSAATAGRYEEIATVLIETGAVTVANLPADRLQALMDRE